MCIRKSQRLRGTDECYREFINETQPGFCPPVWDNFLCWQPTPPGNTSFLPCPRLKGNDVSKFAFRQCLENGTWAQRPGAEEVIPIGWTNYTVCINPWVSDFMKKLEGADGEISKIDFQEKHNIAERSRRLEMVGLTLSIISLILSLIIFYRFRNLQNNRTRIHKNLFIAMSIQVSVRLIVYLDQYLGGILESEYYTIETTSYTCELAYIFLEYGKTATFFWMFVEGLYLHNMITAAVFHESLNMRMYSLIGWGTPLFLVILWASLTYQEFYDFVCWFGYNFSRLFWLLEGPRLVVIGLNLIFLLNIVRVLVTKLKESNSTEAEQVRKAVKAAIVLLPLLGITNSIQMLHSPVDKNILQFAIWSYSTTVLSTFQGFFCALIYCFLNGEVQISVRRYFRTRQHKIATTRKNNFPMEEDPISHPLKEDDGNHGNNGIDVEEQEQGPLQPPPVLVVPPSGDISARGPPETRECRKKDGRKKRTKKKLEKVQVHQDEVKVDPLFEHWSDGELSSHNHVDVEQIEIPLEYFTKNNRTVLEDETRNAALVITQAPFNSSGTNGLCGNAKANLQGATVASILANSGITRPIKPPVDS